MDRIVRRILSTPLLKDCALQRLVKKGPPLFCGLVFHSEAVQDSRVFERLLKFAERLSFRPALCIMTPRNPFIRQDMQKRAVTDAEFDRRIRLLSERYDIGYHGHWCRPASRGIMNYYNKQRITAIEKAGFELTLKDPDAITAQFVDEIGYLKTAGIVPKIYSAGWWYMSDKIARLLAAHGFSLDCSLRYDYPDSFGDRFISREHFPLRGRPFALPAAKTIAEIPSLEYLTMNWWTVAKSIMPLLARGTGPSLAVFPAHDYNLLDNYDKILGNIEFIGRIRNIRWVDQAQLLREATAQMGS